VLREGAVSSSPGSFVYLLLLIWRVLQGDAAYQEFLTWSARPSVLVLDIVSFLFLVYHAITFFDAAPRALWCTSAASASPSSWSARRTTPRGWSHRPWCSGSSWVRK